MKTNKEQDIVSKTVKLNAEDVAEIDELCSSMGATKAQLFHEMLFAYKKDNLITTNPDLNDKLQRFNEYHKCQLNILTGLVQFAENQDVLIKQKYDTRIQNDVTTISGLREELKKAKDDKNEKDDLLVQKESLVKDLLAKVEILEENNNILKENNRVLKENQLINDEFKTKYENVKSNLEELKKEYYQMKSANITLKSNIEILERQLEHQESLKREILEMKQNEIISLKKECEILKAENCRCQKELEHAESNINRIVVPHKRLR